jgi:hypothetical protein
LCASLLVELIKNLGKLSLYLQEELQRERDERNYYQMERDRIDTFWEVTRRELGNICINLPVTSSIFRQTKEEAKNKVKFVYSKVYLKHKKLTSLCRFVYFLCYRLKPG